LEWPTALSLTARWAPVKLVNDILGKTPLILSLSKDPHLWSDRLTTSGMRLGECEA